MSTLAEIWTARRRIAPIAIKTPVITDPTGSGLRLKAENLQRTGSFKIRGAANRVMVAVQEGATHVVTGSSGNHGQAVAWVAQHLGIKATVVVPETTPAVKLRGMRAYGAVVEICGTTSTERLARAAQISQEQGAVFIAPYDDPLVIAGQGTAGLEILEQAEDADTVYVPVGGGGLCSGVAIAIKQSNPWVRVIAVEPEQANDTYLSFQKGEIVSIGGSGSIADGLRSSQPGDLTFPILRKYVDDVILVSEAEILAAGRWLLESVKLVAEPSGAVTVAGALKRGPERAVALISGGNIDLDGLTGVKAWEKGSA